VATDFAGFCGFRRRPCCRELPPVATALLHNCSIQFGSSSGLDGTTLDRLDGHAGRACEFGLALVVGVERAVVGGSGGDDQEIGCFDGAAL
jgi:hypothetical protein